MNEKQPSQHPHGNPNSDSARGGHRPYWKRAHLEGRLWIGVLVMLVAMTIFVMSDGFSLWPRWHPQPQLNQRP